ncbi:hypothetical protein DUI87_02216 [Hirundo rustica rustica]|uniref:Uncharacterized protein n=1 Tax=Hirundo rustica rustica TaxID=333673 RepID=A0A3M0LBR9_HIRRU|nr:hypothetical protein DUI87_02216 [Hirundo rustica rustica]
MRRGPAARTSEVSVDPLVPRFRDSREGDGREQGKRVEPERFLSGKPPPDLEHDCLELMSLQTKVSEQDDVEIVVTNIVNPASFLSGSIGEPVIHDCLETIEATYSSHPDLKDTPLEDTET